MQMPQVKYALVKCEGGYDQMSPSLALIPGALKECQNYEVSVNGGYARIGGFERTDGRLKPSDATYRVIQVTSFTNTPTVGQTLTGVTSGATGYIFTVGSNYMLLTKVTGGFSTPEEVRVGATSIGTTRTPALAITPKDSAINYNLAADVYRADIAAVPGSGSVLGVFALNGITYAFRNNAGGTAADLYRQTTSGWTQIAFEYEIEFSNANASVGEGDVLTKGAVTATIRRVMVETGTLVSGTNTGRLIISAPSGGNFTAGAATSDGGGALTLGGAQTAVTMLPNGKFQFSAANFTGASTGKRTYGCDSVNRCWEFDGTYLCPIKTTVAPDTPKYIQEFQNHLFVAIGESCVSSGIGQPYDWSTTHGASRKALGDTITGFLVQPGSLTAGAMAIGCKNDIYMLYGTSSANWNYATFAQGVGAFDYSMQNMSQSFFMSGQGITSLQTSQAYGNFEHSTLTQNINKFIETRKANIACSLVSKDKSQYRIFFTDGYGLYCTLANGEYLGAGVVKLDKTPTSAYAATLPSGNEIMLLGFSDGYVCELDKGSSFDGNPLHESLTFNWYNAKSPRTLKAWKKLSAEIQGESYAQFSVGYKLGYGTANLTQPAAITHELDLSETLKWDTPGLTWDMPGLMWDGKSLMPEEIDLIGTAENIQVTFSGNLDYIYPYTINSLIFHWIDRRQVR